MAKKRDIKTMNKKMSDEQYKKLSDIMKIDVDERRNHIMKDYEKARECLEKIYDKLDFSNEDYEEKGIKIFPKLKDGQADELDDDFLSERRAEMRNLIRDYIRQNKYNSWKETITNSFEKDEVEGQLAWLEFNIQHEPEDTLSTMDVSCAFLDRLGGRTDSEEYYQTLCEIQYYCERIANGDEVVNCLSLLEHCKFDGVLEVMKDGLMRNPSVKDPKNVDAYYSVLIDSRDSSAAARKNKSAEASEERQPNQD